MTKETIKSECQAQYERIMLAEEQLKKLRSLCKHEDTFEGLYSWRVGSSVPAIICSYCGTMIKAKE